MTKILTFDIENSPNLAYVWGKYEQNVLDYEQEWRMLSFAYKWLGEKTTHALSLPDFETYKRDKADDYELVLELWYLLDEADIVIGHNSDRFDIRKTNARFIAHGFKPPAPYKTIDTLKIARKHLMLNSNKLSHLSEYLGIGSKLETGGFGLWLGCMNGNMKAWKKMVSYNKQDVILTEAVYKKLLPWITNHPNVNVFDEKLGACPNCASKKIQKRGWNFTQLSKRQRYQCMSCGRWSSGKIERIEGMEIK